MGLRPNLLLVLPHGLRSDAVGDDGTWPLRTPHLAGLARRGLRLVATSACPTDPGGFVSLLTGLHPRQHGHLDETTRPTLADALPTWLREAGYHVAGIGAVAAIRPCLDQATVVADVADPEPHDCAYWRYLASKGLTAAMAHQRRQRLRVGPFEPDRLLLEPEDDVDGFIARQAVAALEGMPADRPWALLVCFTGPGNDLPPPTLYDGMVNATALRQGFVPADFTALDALAEPAYPRILLQRLEPYTIGHIRADYLGRVSLIDHGVGRLMRTLWPRPDAGRTWSLVGSDRGYLLGEHGLVGPRSFLAGAVEVPVILTPPPGQPPVDAHADGLVSTVDVAVTAARLGRCDVPPAVAGRSLAPLLTGDPVLPPVGGNVSEFNDRLLLETDRFKAVFNRTTRRCLGLYDLLNDADEKTNLIETPRGQNLVDALRWRLADALMPLRAACCAGHAAPPARQGEAAVELEGR